MTDEDGVLVVRPKPSTAAAAVAFGVLCLAAGLAFVVFAFILVEWRGENAAVFVVVFSALVLWVAFAALFFRIATARLSLDSTAVTHRYYRTTGGRISELGRILVQASGDVAADGSIALVSLEDVETLRQVLHRHRKGYQSLYLVLEGQAGRELVSRINLEAFRPDEVVRFVSRLLVSARDAGQGLR